MLPELWRLESKNCISKAPLQLEFWKHSKLLCETGKATLTIPAGKQGDNGLFLHQTPALKYLETAVHSGFLARFIPMVVCSFLFQTTLLGVYFTYHKIYSLQEYNSMVFSKFT